jgi:PAS domain S-box-containing protein
VDEVELAKAACDGCVPDERWHLRKGGGRVFMNGSVHPLPRDAQGREQGFLKIARDETERRRSDDVLRESEGHYRHAAELNTQVAWTATPDGQLDRVAERWREWTGSSGLGQSRGEGLHPDDLAYTVDAWSRSVATGVPYDVEHRVKMLSGGYRWARSRAFPRRDAAGQIVKWYGATEDLHERKLAEERLRTSEARLSAFLSQASAGIASTDREGRFTFVNDRYCELLGRSQETLVAGRMQDVTHPDDLAENVPLFMAAVEGGPAFAFEKRYVRPDVTVVWVRNSVTAIRDAHGAFESILAVSVDITDRKAAEAALRESEARFRNVADHAPMMMRVTDPSGACTYLNRLWYEFHRPERGRGAGVRMDKGDAPGRREARRRRVPVRQRRATAVPSRVSPTSGGRRLPLGDRCGVAAFWAERRVPGLRRLGDRHRRAQGDRDRAAAAG